MDEGKMRNHWIVKQCGITLIELLIALTILGIVMGGSYRLFVAQSKAYTVQDQVVEVQQGIRSTMEVLLRDLRMAGFDDDSPNSMVTVPNPIIIGDDSITVSYEYDSTTRYTVSYARDAVNSRIVRQLITLKDDGSSVPGPQEIILENVDALNFTYGVDGNDDGAMDDQNGNLVIDENDWVSATKVSEEGAKVVAIRVVLIVKPEEINPDIKMINPRTLISTVTLRNLCMNK